MLRHLVSKLLGISRKSRKRALEESPEGEDEMGKTKMDLDVIDSHTPNSPGRPMIAAQDDNKDEVYDVTPPIVSPSPIIPPSPLNDAQIQGTGPDSEILSSSLGDAIITNSIDEPGESGVVQGRLESSLPPILSSSLMSFVAKDQPLGISMPPPKRKKPKRSIEAAEDVCVTDANWRDLQYTWTINSFSKCQDELGNYVTSPDFPSATQHNAMSLDEDMAFYLKVHLKGENEDSEHLAVYIVCKGSEEVLASFELSIVVDGKKLNTRDSKKVCQFTEDKHPAWGFKKFIQFEELQSEGKDYLMGDCLTLHCEVKYVIAKDLRPIHQKLESSALFKAENRIEEGMERLDVDQLWRDRDLHADLAIICQGMTIPANRVLLSARSEVFRAMFSHPTKEATSGKVEISDIEPQILEQMLCYVYTGFAPEVENIAEDLLLAANKYALEELKVECVRVLEGKLNTENVIEMLIVADQYDAQSLKEAALAFLVKRLDVFMDKNFKIMWQRFKENYPELVTETVKVLLEKQPLHKIPV